MAPRSLKRGTASKPEPGPPINEIPPAEVPLPPETPTPEASKSPGIPKDTPPITSNPARPSWYNRTWPRKAAAVTKVAEESISTAPSAASSLTAVSKTTITTKGSSRSPSLQLTKSQSGSNRSLPADATTTKVHATSDPASPSKINNQGDMAKPSQVDGGDVGKAANGNTATPIISASNGDNPKEIVVEDPQLISPARTAEQIGTSWLTWFTKSASATVGPAAEVSESTPQLGKDNKTVQATSEPQNISTSETVAQQPDTRTVAPQPEQLSTPQKRSWLQMWNSGATDTSLAKDRKSDPVTARDTAASIGGASSSALLTDTPAIENKPDGSQSNSKTPSIVTSPPPDLPGDGSKSGWIFWSRDRKGSTNTPGAPHIGELAISDTPSQKKPKRASISLDDGKDAVKEKENMKSNLVITKPKKQSASETETRPETPKVQPTKATDTPTKAKGAELLEATKQLQKAVPSTLLPSFQETFSLQDNPTFWQQLTRLMGYSKSPQARHVNLLRDPPRIKNAIAIGVHGYFPAPLIRSVLGQPTGTSIKFADMATKAIRKWTNAHGYDCQVKSAALEGEGKIAERVDILWKLLLNWIEEIRRADFILVACHSQGVPVAIMLLAKLIAFGCVNSARIGVCAMAGVNMGPFPDYKSRWISGSAAELFEFSKPESTVSKDYLAALESALKFGVRVTYVGSIDDQLVSMESSTFAPVSHPHIYRAVFVDGRVHAPNFLTHLVGFALKLRNLGVLDHGLIRELSAPLAGSLYGGEGHSRLYEDETVYDLAVEFALETTALDHAPLVQRPGAVPTQNPYILPFAMRGLLEEEYVRTELSMETSELLEQFDQWKPTSKVLKDVKFRLEGIRSKL